MPADNQIELWQIMQRPFLILNLKVDLNFKKKRETKKDVKKKEPTSNKKELEKEKEKEVENTEPIYIEPNFENV